MSNLLKRFITGITLGSVVIASVVLSPWGAFVLCALVALVGMAEFYKITGLKTKVSKGFFLLAAFVFWAALAYELAIDQMVNGHHFYSIFRQHFVHFLGGTTALGAVLLLFEKQVKHPAQEMGMLVMGMIYVMLPMLMFFQIPFQTEWHEYHFQGFLGILFLTWAVDTAAYFGGRFLGKHKLWERISPKKTWEGSISGALACIGLSIAFKYWWQVEFDWIIVGILTAIFSQLGDLVESMYKRGLHIKDSGGILPGHGGVLDRFDGLLVAIPVIYLYIIATN